MTNPLCERQGWRSQIIDQADTLLFVLATRAGCQRAPIQLLQAAAQGAAAHWELLCSVLKIRAAALGSAFSEMKCYVGVSERLQLCGPNFGQT